MHQPQAWAHKMRDLRAFDLNDLLTLKLSPDEAKKEACSSFSVMYSFTSSAGEGEMGPLVISQKELEPRCLWPAGGSVTSFLLFPKQSQVLPLADGKTCECNIQRKHVTKVEADSILALLAPPTFTCVK